MSLAYSTLSPPQDHTGHEPILVASHVSKSFPGVVALDDVSFEIRPGEVNALVGENGAGKSTLIKMMAGFHGPDSGEIRVLGQPLLATPAAAHDAGIATIHQDSHLVPNMTVAENIMLGHWPARFGVISRRSQVERARAAIARVAPSFRRTSLQRAFLRRRDNLSKLLAPYRRIPRF